MNISLVIQDPDCEDSTLSTQLNINSVLSNYMHTYIRSYVYLEFLIYNLMYVSEENK